MCAPKGGRWGDGVMLATGVEGSQQAVSPHRCPGLNLSPMRSFRGPLTFLPESRHAYIPAPRPPRRVFCCAGLRRRMHHTVRTSRSVRSGFEAGGEPAGVLRVLCRVFDRDSTGGSQLNRLFSLLALRRIVDGVSSCRQQFGPGPSSSPDTARASFSSATTTTARDIALVKKANLTGSRWSCRGGASSPAAELHRLG